MASLRDFLAKVGLVRDRVSRDPEVIRQKMEATVELRRHHNLYKEIAAIQRQLERTRREVPKGS